MKLQLLRGPLAETAAERDLDGPDIIVRMRERYDPLPEPHVCATLDAHREPGYSDWKQISWRADHGDLAWIRKTAFFQLFRGMGCDYEDAAHFSRNANAAFMGMEARHP